LSKQKGKYSILIFSIGQKHVEIVEILRTTIKPFLLFSQDLNKLHNNVKNGT
jgi:hypothetical protein